MNINGQTQTVLVLHADKHSVSLFDGEDFVIVEIQDAGVSLQVGIEGGVVTLLAAGASADHAGLEAGDTITAPLPGKIVSLVTKPGAAVKKGDPLLTLEAMKMEHALKAPRDGVVGEVTVAEGAQVKEGEVLVRLEEAAS